MCCFLGLTESAGHEIARQRPYDVSRLSFNSVHLLYLLKNATRSNKSNFQVRDERDNKFSNVINSRPSATDTSTENKGRLKLVAREPTTEVAAISVLLLCFFSPEPPTLVLAPSLTQPVC